MLLEALALVVVFVLENVRLLPFIPLLFLVPALIASDDGEPEVILRDLRVLVAVDCKRERSAEAVVRYDEEEDNGGGRSNGNDCCLEEDDAGDDMGCFSSCEDGETAGVEEEHWLSRGVPFA